MTEAAIKVPLRERFNWRVLGFVGIVVFLLGYPAYLYISDAVTGGMKQVGDYTEVNLKALGNFYFPENGTIENVPHRWRELDGKKVLLEGEVFAPNEAGDNMTRFELVYSISKCCFGGPPKVQERVYVVVPPEMKIPNLSYAFARVTGTLRVAPKTDAGQVVELYTLSLENIEPM
jgi:hypothetical protein